MQPSLEILSEAVAIGAVEAEDLLIRILCVADQQLSLLITHAAS
jgi:hypothetical protein